MVIPFSGRDLSVGGVVTWRFMHAQTISNYYFSSHSLFFSLKAFSAAYNGAEDGGSVENNKLNEFYALTLSLQSAMK